LDSLAAGDYAIPFQSVSAVLLGPGGSVSHDALRLLARATVLLAIGAGGSRLYTAQRFWPDESRLARRQARVGADPTPHGHATHQLLRKFELLSRSIHARFLRRLYAVSLHRLAAGARSVVIAGRRLPQERRGSGRTEMPMADHDVEDLLTSARAAQFEYPRPRPVLARRHGTAVARRRKPARTESPAEGISLRSLAVLVSDVVSYSRLVEEDGVGTVRQIRAMRQSILMPLARRYRACVCRAFGGDSALMGFTNPIASLRCAVELQRQMAMLGEHLAYERRIRLRIGLSFGSGLMVDGTVYGTAVNVAARLQALARPDRICLSRDLVTVVQDSLRLELEEMGEYRLKNISRPVEVYQLVAAGSADVRVSAIHGALTEVTVVQPMSHSPHPLRCAAES
jgi:class 3 adenylate cyclase